MPPPRLPTSYTRGWRSSAWCTGRAFRRIVDAQVSDGRVLARVDATDIGIAGSNHQAHPAVLDAALQCVALLAEADDASVDGAVVPAAVRHVRQFAELTRPGPGRRHPSCRTLGRGEIGRRRRAHRLRR